MTVKFLDPIVTTLPITTLQPKAGNPGAITAIAPNGQVWSVDANGTVTQKAPNFDGGHETAQVNGSVLAYQPEGDGRYVVVAFELVSAL